MHTENHIQAAGGVDPEPLDDQVAEMYHRGAATEEPRPAPTFTHPLGEALGYPPLCAHGVNSFADRGYELALARLTLERQTPIHITPVERNHHVPVPVPPTNARHGPPACG